MKYLIPYPLRAAKISLSLNPFGFWSLPLFGTTKWLSSEKSRAKQSGSHDGSGFRFRIHGGHKAKETK